MELSNQTSHNYRAYINDVEYDLAGNKSIFFDFNGETKIKLISTDKPYVHLNWFDIILLQMFFGSTTLTRMNADYSFIVDNDVQKITLDYNDWHVREQIYIDTCYAKENVVNESYTLSNFNKVKKKHKNLHLLVSSAWPIGVAILIASFLTEPPYWFIILFLVWLVVFAIPSLKEIKRFNQVVKPEFVNDKLCEYASQRRVDPLVFTEDTSKTGKIIGKILDKMFKFSEDKK